MGGFQGTDAIAPNAPLVVSETIDGEAIIMHHGTGHYFDTSGSGAMIWQAIERVSSLDAIAAQLSEDYAIAPDRAHAVAVSFLEVLVEHDLVKTVEAATVSTALPPNAVAPFAEPVLGVHADLADMLLLDPIHDVDEAGWPAARPHASAA